MSKKTQINYTARIHYLVVTEYAEHERTSEPMCRIFNLSKNQWISSIPKRLRFNVVLKPNRSCFKSASKIIVLCCNVCIK